MQTLTDIRAILAQHGLSPRKALGQNFLLDHNLIRKLVDASGVGAGDVVLEVGPGTGTLTEELLSRGCRVIACELDHGLARMLRERLGSTTSGSFTLIEGDCLEGKHALNEELTRTLREMTGESAGVSIGTGGGGRGFRLVANLPYGAASPLMTTLLASWASCRSMHVTIQREVADRLLAKPGTDEYGTLGIIAQAAAEVSLVATLPPECFWPRPDVTSAMVSIVRRVTPLTDDLPRLAACCQKVFGQRRKQIGSVLGRGFAFPPGIEASQRAEQLSVEQLIELSRVEGAF
ncbi:MAG: ribosomal RNA small subunit methyltransferase A [Phycisphaerales bacterium]|nr:ribosomal RNA small subunit methyltransferase A [Phycisphaerales bacterium]